jgi:predicted enzyme related to lactoylglutathione lyase
MAKLVHVEITAADVPATADFYALVLGATSDPSPYAPNYTMLTSPQGPVGAVMDNSYKAQATIAWFEVDDLDAALERAKRAGGRQVGDVNDIPGQGRLAYVGDLNGTLFGLRQPE